ncbi:P protein-like [Leptidea sinapis]|uniref:P protein-like n=1 Tax=Leptidea sinapis TaxID=189913 RepID=UPI0021C29AE6|nr:P protein-like [Leptidea sinapis]
MEKIWRLVKGKNSSKREVNQSTYSLVSCGELTPESLLLWNGLPDVIKKDPSLEKIRLRYEEFGAADCVDIPNNIDVVQLSINSEPISFVDNDTEDITEDDAVRAQSVSSRGSRKESQNTRTRHYIKMTVLLGCWLFFTFVFMTHNEKVEYFRTTAVAPSTVNNYTLDISNSDSVLIKLLGPFLSGHAEIKLNKSVKETANRLIVWFENDTHEISTQWHVFLKRDNLNFNEGESREHIFRMATNSTNSKLRMRTTTSSLIALRFSFTADPLDGNSGVVYAVILLFGLYVLIIFEVINRTMAALIVSTTSLAALALVGERPTLPEIISWLDVETLLLLFSMMILVAIMAETGIFDFLAVFTFEVTKGRLWPLIYILCIITAVLSTFLDNVTTVLLMSPVTIRLCEVMDLDPVPILMFMAMYSNVGGTATPVGDPPNVIVASNKAVIQAGINFTNFTAHMSFGILFIVIQTSLQIRYIYRDVNKLRLKVPRDIQGPGNIAWKIIVHFGCTLQKGP